MTDSAPRHLVAVWNPSYGADVMESHIMLLRERARRFRQGDEDEENVYVWWGKIRSSHRQQALPHIEEILALEDELGESEGDAKRELQLYLTDYRSLYVAHVAEITAEDAREDDDDADAHIPAVLDIRRLVSDDTLAVVDELAKLSNTAYHGMPVSISLETSTGWSSTVSTAALARRSVSCARTVSAKTPGTDSTRARARS